MTLFEDAKPRPPIARRRWSDPPNEAERLLQLSPKISDRSGRVQRTEAREYADLYARQIKRRELVALRRRAEEWAEAAVRIEPDPDVLLGIVALCRDLAEALDERIADNGGVDTTPDGGTE